MKKIFRAKICVPALLAATSVLTQNKGPGTEAHFWNAPPPPPSFAGRPCHPPPPPPPQSNFRAAQYLTSQKACCGQWPPRAPIWAVTAHWAPTVRRGGRRPHTNSRAAGRCCASGPPPRARARPGIKLRVSGVIGCGCGGFFPGFCCCVVFLVVSCMHSTGTWAPGCLLVYTPLLTLAPCCVLGVHAHCRSVSLCTSHRTLGNKKRRQQKHDQGCVSPLPPKMRHTRRKRRSRHRPGQRRKAQQHHCCTSRSG